MLLDNKKIEEKQRQISEKYFYTEKKGAKVYTRHYPVYEILLKAKSEKKLPKLSYKVEIPHLNNKTLTSILHFTPDPKIKRLVISFNRLGFQTTQSCQGHKYRGEPYPCIDFYNINLFNILALVRGWKQLKNPHFKISASPFHLQERYKQTFRLIFDTGNLKDSQTLALDLAEYIEKKE